VLFVAESIFESAQGIIGVVLTSVRTAHRIGSSMAAASCLALEEL
jgi:hypothetical protein